MHRRKCEVCGLEYLETDNLMDIVKRGVPKCPLCHSIIDINELVARHQIENFLELHEGKLKEQSKKPAASLTKLQKAEKLFIPLKGGPSLLSVQLKEFNVEGIFFTSNCFHSG
jgi:hypothetical protein